MAIQRGAQGGRPSGNWTARQPVAAPTGGKYLGDQLTPSPMKDRDIVAGTTTNREIAERYGGGDGWYNQLFNEHAGMADNTNWGSRGRDDWSQNISTGGLNAGNQEKMNRLVSGTYDQLDSQAARPQGNAAPAMAGGGKGGGQAPKTASQAGPQFGGGGKGGGAPKNPYGAIAKEQGMPAPRPAVNTPATQYGSGGMANQTRALRQALPNMNAKTAPMGGGAGE